MTLWHAVWSHSVSTLLTEDRVALPNMESTSTQSVNMWVCLCVYVNQRETEQRPDVCVKNRLLVQFSAAVSHTDQNISPPRFCLVWSMSVLSCGTSRKLKRCVMEYSSRKPSAQRMEDSREATELS